MQNILLVALGIAVAIIAALVLKLFGKATPISQPVPTAKETEAIAKATGALEERAKVAAKTEEKKKVVEEILKIEDPNEKLVRLAEQLKDL